MNLERRTRLSQDSHTVVVKVGTRVLVDERGYLDPDRVAHLADQLMTLRRQRRVVLVSSGAVAAGMNTLGYKKRPADLAELQAVAAVGQAKLIESYNHEFRRHRVAIDGAEVACHAAQVLLGADDFQNRVGYLNVRNTLLRLLDFPNVIPVINENDTVSVEELQTTFGDNDKLAALVTNMLRAPLLIILSTVDGLMDDRGQVVPVVEQFDERILGYVCDQKTGLSKGGMASKLNNARLCTSSGETVIIANGRRPDVLTQILAGEPLGTLFVPQSKSVSPRKRWIGAPATSRGKVLVNAGACEAIRKAHGSLLAVGVVAVEGEFRKGDVVSLYLAGESGEIRGKEFARGLSNYSSDDLVRIQGSQSQRIAEILGHRPYEEVIHRDNMVLVE
ncbi:MAG: glutamate 5-kinase [Pirellulales bacterium]